MTLTNLFGEHAYITYINDQWFDDFTDLTMKNP